MLILNLLGNIQMKEAPSLQRSDVDSERGVLINGNSKVLRTDTSHGSSWVPRGWVAGDGHRRRGVDLGGKGVPAEE